jgi:2-polyprenyl-3-methyl-5-hydroxy-6-metoxy-1,4-benzoquinol methylase
MNPQPVPEEIERRYSGGHGEDYLQYEIANEKSFLNLQLFGLQDAGFFDQENSVLERCREAGVQASVLDIGCATGSLIAYLEQHGWDATGLELSAQEAAYAASRGLKVQKSTLEGAAFPAESFDVILASHLVEHLNNPRSFFHEARRVIKKDGRIYITTPNIAGFQAKLFGNRWRSAIFDHLYLFSVRTLRAIMESEGFTIERIATWGGLAAGTAPAPIKRLADKLAKRYGFGDVMLLVGAPK